MSGNPISSVVMALVCEYFEDYIGALKMWQSLNGSKSSPHLREGCERTVAILRKLKDKNLVKDYGMWILETDPKIGLTLFTTNQKTGEPPIEMDVEEVIDFLKNLNNEAFPYLESYYEYVIANQNAPDTYYTSLATLYVDKIFKWQPRNYATPNDNVADKVKEYRGKLQRFLETKKQYE